MTEKVAISLPPELLRLVEFERARRGLTRSEFVRVAVLEHLERVREREAVRAYQDSYRNDPEVEVDRWTRLAAEVWADLPWDEELDETG